MLTFRIKGQELKLEQIYYIDARFVVGEHPESGQPCLFIRQGEPTPYVALRRLGLSVSSPTRDYKGILYYELTEVTHGSEEAVQNVILPGGSGNEGVHREDNRTLDTQGVGQTSKDKTLEGTQAA